MIRFLKDGMSSISSDSEEILKLNIGKTIWKSQHRHLGISISIGVGIGIAILRSLYFCLSKFYMKKTSIVKYFSSTLSDLPRGFRRCLEQLFCRKSVSAWFERKELHNRHYLRSFKNTLGLKLHFAGL